MTPVSMNEVQCDSRRWYWWIHILVPLLAFGGLVWVFLQHGLLGVFEADIPPIENLMIQRITFTPEHIVLHVFNDGPEPVTVAQLTVNEVLWQFSMEPTITLEPLERGWVSIFYPWTDGDPLSFTLISRNGVTFEKDIDVSFLTPVLDKVHIQTFILLGLYVGVIPVLLGLLWFPWMRRFKENGYSFFLALTIGLLLFLGVDTLAEGLELIEEVPGALNGEGLLLIGILLSVLILGSVSYRTEFAVQKFGGDTRSLVWGYLIALGIGFHNLGEGLAIGSAYALGEVALGGALVLGFMAHNLTEGIAIVAPMIRHAFTMKRAFPHLVLMGLLAGGPTIVGTLLGGFAYSPVVGVLFLGIGSGAIFDVSFDILHHMAGGRWKSLFTLSNVLGFLLGLLLMYGTGILVLL
ncbi:metal transporter [Candidatus Peregrinibacteria bacterium]|nr:metal transporter [Candidatus Peregrinibacteria bacterium]